MPRLLAVAAVLAATLPLAAQSAAPDTIYYHGHILTGVGLGQGRLDFVSAIAMRDGIITATGTDSSLLKVKGLKTQLVDLGGSFA
ncbi:MAG: amidohydrolase, partial [Acidobacteriaceae bacterium]